MNMHVLWLIFGAFVPLGQMAGGVSSGGGARHVTIYDSTHAAHVPGEDRDLRPTTAIRDGHPSS